MYIQTDQSAEEQIYAAAQVVVLNDLSFSIISEVYSMVQMFDSN